VVEGERGDANTMTQQLSAIMDTGMNTAGIVMPLSDGVLIMMSIAK